jgi:hypothetical protein
MTKPGRPPRSSFVAPVTELPAGARPLGFVAFCERVLGFRFTPGQRVLARVADGEHPGDLRGDERELARRMFGDVERVPDRARAVLTLAKGRGMGASRLCGMKAVHAALTLPLDALSPGEAAHVFLCAPKLRLSRVTLRFALSAARAAGLTLASETADQLEIARHDGRTVILSAIPASRGGDAVRAVPVVFAALDEACFFFDEQTGVANDAALFNAITPRLLPGGQVWLLSSPWAESGLLWTEYTRNWAAPRTSLAAHCPTLLMRNDATTRAMVERETERDPANAEREFGARFLPSGSSSFFDRPSVSACVDRELAAATSVPAGARVALGLDIGLQRDCSAAVVLHVFDAPERDDGDKRPCVLRVAETLELHPRKGAPLSLGDVAAQFAALAARHGALDALSDNVQLSELQRLLGDRLSVTAAKDGQHAKVERYLALREAMRSARLKIPAALAGALSEQLSLVISHPTAAGGMAIKSPRRAGSHGDLVSALVLAVALAERNAERGDERFLSIASRTSARDPRYARPARQHAEGVATREGWAATAAELDDDDETTGEPWAVTPGGPGRAGMVSRF